MLFPAAKILQQREADRREAHRDRLLTICGLMDRRFGAVSERIFQDRARPAGIVRIFNQLCVAIGCFSIERENELWIRRKKPSKKWTAIFTTANTALGARAGGLTTMLLERLEAQAAPFSPRWKH